MLLPPLPATLAAWAAADYPDVFAEVRDGEGCWIVGTLETHWDGPAHPSPVVRVRDVVPFGDADVELPELELAPGILIRPPHAPLAAAVERAEQARLRSFRHCVDCGELTAPEHGARLEGGFTCHGCMQRNHGIVF
jgi:hypothetical protein